MDIYSHFSDIWDTALATLTVILCLDKLARLLKETASKIMH